MGKCIDGDNYRKMRCIEEIKEEGIYDKWERNIVNKIQLRKVDYLGRKLNKENDLRKNIN